MASLSLRGRVQTPALSVNHLKLRSGKTNRFKRLNSRVKEISEEQKEVKEGQREVREKFEAIEAECEQLRKETGFLMKQNVRSQIASALMSRILKAGEAEDLNIVASLTKIFVLAVSFWLSEHLL